MRELTHEEKTAILRVAILFGIFFLLVIGILILNSPQQTPPPDPLPDYHMTPFGLFTNNFFMAGINK